MYTIIHRSISRALQFSAALAIAFPTMYLVGCVPGTNPLDPPTSSTIQNADRIAIADFNGDGAPDLAIGSTLNGREGFFTGFVSVLYQNAASPGTFQHSIDTELGSGNNPWTMIATDVDGIGGPDLVVGPGANTIRLYLQNANSTSLFSNAKAIDYLGVPLGMAAVDLNGDGATDLAVTADRGADGIALFFQNPLQRGAFVQSATPLATTTFAIALASVDMNNDGRPDLVASTTTAANSGLVSVYLHSATDPAGFAARTDYPAGTYPRSIALADLNGDGRVDVAVANSSADGSTGLLILFQDTNGGDALLAPVPYTTVPYPQVVATGDLNGDGRIDIVVANGDSARSISVFLQSSLQRGAFLPAANYMLSCVPSDIAIGDLNSDHLPDIALACGERATILFNSLNSPGTFNAPTTIGR